MLRRLQRLTLGPLRAGSGERPPAAEARVGYDLFAGHLLTVFGLALSNAFLAFMILWAAWRRRDLTWDWVGRMVLMVPAAIYLAFFVGSVASSLDPGHSAEELRDVFSFATLFLAPVLVRGRIAVRKLCDLLVGLGVVISVYGLVQYYFTDLGELHRRIVGPFSHVQTFSGILLILLLVTVARLTRDGRRRSRLWLWAALALISWTLVLTLTRGAWVAALVVLGGLILWAWRRYPVYAGAAAVLLAVVVASAPQQAAERLGSIFDLRDASNYDRLCMAEAAIFMVQESPLFGIGPEMVEERYPIYRHPTAPRVQVPHLHSTFLQRAAEQGLLGLGAYLWLTLAALLLAWRGLRRSREDPDADSSDLYLAALLVVVGFNVAGLFEDNWRDTEVRRLLLFFLALPLCLRAPSLPAGSEETHT